MGVCVTKSEKAHQSLTGRLLLTTGGGGGGGGGRKGNHSECEMRHLIIKLNTVPATPFCFVCETEKI